MRHPKSKDDNSSDLSNWPDKSQQSTESLTSEECSEATPDQAFCRWLHQIWAISNNVTSRLKYFLRASSSSHTNSSSDGSLETNVDESSSDELSTNETVEAGEQPVRHHQESCGYAQHSLCAHGMQRGYLCLPSLPCANKGHAEEHRGVEENDLGLPETKLPGNVSLRNSIPRPVLILPRIRHENNAPRMYIPEVFQRVRTGCRYRHETRNYQVYWNEYAQTRQCRMDNLVGYQIPERLCPATSLRPKTEINNDGNVHRKRDDDGSEASKDLTGAIGQSRISQRSSMRSSKNMKDSSMDVNSEKYAWDSRLSDILSQDLSSNEELKDDSSLGSSLHSMTEENISTKHEIRESQDERQEEDDKDLDMNIEENGLKVNVINGERKEETQAQMAAANELCQERKFSLTTESCFDTLLTSLRAKMNSLNAETHLNGVKMSTSLTPDKVKRSLSFMTDTNVDNNNCTLEKYSRTAKKCKANCDDTRLSFSKRIQDIWQDSDTVPWNSFYKEEPLKFIYNERQEPTKMSIFGLKKESGFTEGFGEYGTAVKLANILEAMTEAKVGKCALIQEQEISKTTEEPQRLLPDKSKSKISHIGIQYSLSTLTMDNEKCCRTENSKDYEKFDNKLVNVSIDTPRSLQIFTEHSILPMSTVEIKPLTHQIQGFAQYHVLPQTMANMNSTFSSDCGDLPKQHSITRESPFMKDPTDVPIFNYKLKKDQWLSHSIKVPPSINCQMLVQGSISTRIRSWVLQKFHRKRSNANLPVGQRFKRIRPSIMNKKFLNLLRHVKRKEKLGHQLEETHVLDKFPKKMPIPPIRRRRKRYKALNKQNVDAVLKNVMLSNNIDSINSCNKERVNVNSDSTKSINNEIYSTKVIREDTPANSNSIRVTSSTLSIKDPVAISSQENVINQLKSIENTDISINQNKDEGSIQLYAEDSLWLPEKNCVDLKVNQFCLKTGVSGEMPLTDTIDHLRTSKLETKQDVNKVNCNSNITNSSPRIAESCEKKNPLNNSTTDTSTNNTASGLDNKSDSVEKKEFYRKKYQFLSRQILKKKQLDLKQPEAQDVKDKIGKKKRYSNTVSQDEPISKSDEEESINKYKKHENSYKRRNNKKMKCANQSLSPINEIEPLNEKLDSSLNIYTRMYGDKIISLKKLDKTEVTKVKLISRVNELLDTARETNKNIIPIKEYKMENQGTQSYVSYHNERRNLQGKRSSITAEARIPITSIKSHDKDISYCNTRLANNSVQQCSENRTESKRTTITDPYLIYQRVANVNRVRKTSASNGSRSSVGSSNIATRVERRNPNENKLMYLSRMMKKMEESSNAKLSIAKEIKAESDIVLQMSNDDCTTPEKRNKSISYALVEEGLRVPECSGYLESAVAASKISKTHTEYKETEILERLMQVSEKVESTMVKKIANCE